MKILSDKAKKFEKKKYKYRNRYQYCDTFISSEKIIVPTYVRKMDINKYEKRVDKYVYQYNRLMTKKDFFEKRILNLTEPTRKELFKNKQNMLLMVQVLKCKDLNESLEKVNKIEGQIVSDDIIIYEMENFYKSLLKFSSLIKQASNILDKFDPKHKNKFKYNKLKNFLLYGRSIYSK